MVPSHDKLHRLHKLLAVRKPPFATIVGRYWEIVDRKKGVCERYLKNKEKISYIYSLAQGLDKPYVCPTVLVNISMLKIEIHIFAAIYRNISQ